MKDQNGYFIQKQSIKSAAGVAAILLYWLVYFWQDALSNHGDYRWFSYSFHELYSAGYPLAPLLTALWLLVLCIRSAKNRAWRKNRFLIATLAILLLLQTSYLHHRTQIVSVNAWTEVVEILDAYHIVILNGEDQRVTLETPPIVTKLLRTDGTIYGFSYERTKTDPSEGTLHYIWDTIE